MTKSKLYASLAAASVLLLVSGIPAAYAESTFGMDWTESSLAPTAMASPFFQSVTFGNGTFVAVHDNDDSDAEAFWSEAATVNTWTEATGDSGDVTPGGVDVVFGAGKFVSINYNDTPLYSSDNGRTWSEGTVETGSGSLVQSYRNVAYGNGTFVALSGNGTALISTDGMIWSEETGEKVSGLTGFEIEDLIFSGTNFVAVGQQTDEVGNLEPAILISSTGTAWTRTFTKANVSEFQQPVKAVSGDGAGNLLALQSTTSGTTSLRSTDHGATWVKAGAFTEDQPWSAGYADGAWFAGGSNYGIMRSVDFGETWLDDTNFPDGPSETKPYQFSNDFSYGDGILVSAGSGETPVGEVNVNTSPIFFTGTYTPSGGGGDNGGGGNNNQLANTGSRDNSRVVLGSLSFLIFGAAAITLTIRARQQKI